MKFYFSIPKSWSKKKTKANLNMACVKKVDLDNLIKFFFDTFNDVLYDDDSQIYNLHAIKLWAIEGFTTVQIDEVTI